MREHIYRLSGGWATRGWVRKLFWQMKGARSIPVSSCQGLTGSHTTCGGWSWRSCRGGLGPSVRRSGYGRARRRVRRVVRVRVAVTDNDAVLELRVCRRACHAQAHVQKRRRRHGVPRVLHIQLLHHFELAGCFRPCVDILQEGHIRRAHRSRQNDGSKWCCFALRFLFSE